MTKFYRNLYEEHKKKRALKAKGGNDIDEKKKKEKDDVAEILGKKGSSSKKKKATLKSKNEPLGPPTLTKTGSFSLDKKPLPGLSSGGGSGRLNSLSALGSSGGLKQTASLGVRNLMAKSYMNIEYMLCTLAYQE